MTPSTDEIEAALKAHAHYYAVNGNAITATEVPTPEGAMAAALKAAAAVREPPPPMDDPVAFNIRLPVRRMYGFTQMRMELARASDPSRNVEVDVDFAVSGAAMYFFVTVLGHRAPGYFTIATGDIIKLFTDGLCDYAEQHDGLEEQDPDNNPNALT